MAKTEEESKKKRGKGKLYLKIRFLYSELLFTLRKDNIDNANVGKGWHER